ncbi:hypothetical protein [Methyloterricola oryzae]|uniref:hypothetical protein n=1 Tax=Methyloterricola oryzae TaxID=1495050 RepID=UPI0006998C57|nr:hypothetical protein [Methyloterricola oryzae]
MNTPRLAALAVAFLLSGLERQALAECPTTGTPLIVKEDGNVIATFNGKSKGTDFNNDLFLQSPDGAFSGVIFNNFTSTPGSSVNLGFFKAGTELVFRLHVTNTDQDFYTGSANSNPDGLPHARVTGTAEGAALVEFEDLAGLPECPGEGFNDLSFTFSNLAPSNQEPDHYLSFKARPASGSAPNTITHLELSDAVGKPGRFVIGKPLSLAFPASIDGTEIHSPNLALERYQLVRKPKAARRRWEVKNEFGVWNIKTKRADSVLMPTGTSATGPAETPVLESQGIQDPLACYSAQLIKPAKFKALKKTIASEGISKHFRIKQPKRLCTPAARDGQATKVPDAHLLCFAAVPLKKQPKHSTVTLSTVNQLGSGSVETIKETEVCVPSTLSRKR